jgi:integrase
MLAAVDTNSRLLTVLIEASLLKTTQQGVMRGGESTSGIRACDAMWLKKGRRIKLLLRRTKTSRTGPGVSVTLAVSRDPFCAVRLLRKQWDMRHLDDHPDAFLFPRVTPDHAIVETSAYTAAALRALVKRSVALVGLPPQGYSSHSLRAGGATDLLDAGVAETTVQQYGRWKSEAFRIYYRHNNQAVKDVAAAFGWLARK